MKHAKDKILGYVKRLNDLQGLVSSQASTPTSEGSANQRSEAAATQPVLLDPARVADISQVVPWQVDKPPELATMARELFQVGIGAALELGELYHKYRRLGEEKKQLVREMRTYVSSLKGIISHVDSQLNSNDDVANLPSDSAALMERDGHANSVGIKAGKCALLKATKYRAEERLAFVNSIFGAVVEKGRLGELVNALTHQEAASREEARAVEGGADSDTDAGVTATLARLGLGVEEDSEHVLAEGGEEGVEQEEVNGLDELALALENFDE